MTDINLDDLAIEVDLDLLVQNVDPIDLLEALREHLAETGQPGRDLALALTKLDEAVMWLDRADD